MLACCLAVAALLVTPAREMQDAPSELVVRQERFGFELTRPSAEWGFAVDAPAQQRNPEQPLCTLSLFAKSGNGLPSVVVFVSAWDGSYDAQQACAALRTKLVAANASELVDATLRVGELEAPSVRGVMRALDGRSAGVEYACVTRAPYLYVVQAGWPKDDASARAEIERCAASFALRAPQVEDESTAKLRTLAARCGSELEWARDWESAATRAKDEHKLVWIAYEEHAGLEAPATQDADLYTDPELVALLRERFVALRLDAHAPASFRAPEAFGMGEKSWGSAILCVAPDGRVQRTCALLDLACVYAVACDVLARGASSPSSVAKDACARAELDLNRGELARALESIAKLETWQADLLRARVHRLQRDGASALTDVRQALQKAPAESQRDVQVEKGRIHLRMGARAEAAAAFERALEGDAKPCSRASEALFWLGALDVLAQGLDAGSTRWKSLVAEHPQSPWAWKAAANLLRQGSLSLGGERLSWPPREVFDELAPLATHPLATREMARVKRDALAYLVRTQRGDGAWTSAIDRLYEHDPADLGGLGVYTPAITAVCAQSLLAERAQPDVERALKKARDFLEQLEDSGQLEPHGGLLGVYSIWGRAWALAFHARCCTLRYGERAELERRTRALITSIAASQHKGGGWPYITLPGDPRGEGVDPSTSFLTAGVVLALLEARAAGIEVEAGVIEKALAFLQRVRLADGSYLYFGGVPDADPSGEHREASGRGPVCTLALVRGGKLEREDLERSLDVFLKHKPSLARQWRKDLCHTGPEGQGSHYLFFDYRFAAAAMRGLQPDARRRLRGPLLNDVLAARLEDGSFEDIPMLGRAYGTAMALMTLADLERE